ncbi:MAG: hypothetical protein ACHQ52_14235, partial [Candidatus Eisenbacteria bacterium]
MTALLERAYPAPSPELPNERVTSRARTLRRRRRVSQTLAAAIVAAAVVIAAVVVIDGGSAAKVSVPPATRPHVPVPNVTVDHELLVTPSTGLRDGQPIHVSGRHFVVGVGHGGHASSISLVTCRAGATPANWDQQCDSRTAGGTSDSDIRSRVELRRGQSGHPARKNSVDVVGYQYAAARHLTLPGGSVDCALEPCVVLAVGFDTGYGAAPLQFDPDAASLPTPRVTVTPATDLQEGQQVTIHVEDAWPGGADNRGAIVSLCAFPGISPVCDQTDLGVPAVTGIDGQGRATLTMTVKSTVLASGCCTAGDTAGVADCAASGGCVISVQVPVGPLGGQIAQLAVPISFAADVSARPLADRLPHASIDPPGPYTDSQEVTISATRVPSGTAVGLCGTMSATNPTYLECAPGGVTATGKIVLHRFIDEPIPDPAHSKRIDCAKPGRCALYLYNTPGENPLPTFA